MYLLCKSTTPRADASLRSGLNSPLDCSAFAGFESVLHTRKAVKNKNAFVHNSFSGGGVGIRTLDTLVGYTHLAGEHLRPLGHSSARNSE